MNTRNFSILLFSILLLMLACNPTGEEDDNTIPLNPDNCTRALELSITEANKVAVDTENDPIL